VVEVHALAMKDDVMSMRQVPAVALTAGKDVELEPRGYHVMLMDLKQQLKAGEVMPLTLVFKNKDGKRETVEIQAEVRALNTGAHAARHGELRR
jgi:copper(I)-binding protein